MKKTQKRKREKVFVGFRDLGLKGGEEIEIVSGIAFDNTPTRCTVVKEYPKFLFLEMEYGRRPYERRVKQCINKSALFLGEVLIRRAGTQEDLTGRAVCNVGYIYYLEVQYEKKETI